VDWWYHSMAGRHESKLTPAREASLSSSRAPKSLRGAIDIGGAYADIVEQPVVKGHQVHPVPMAPLPDEKGIDHRFQPLAQGVNETGPVPRGSMPGK